MLYEYYDYYDLVFFLYDFQVFGIFVTYAGVAGTAPPALRRRPPNLAPNLQNLKIIRSHLILGPQRYTPPPALGLEKIGKWLVWMIWWCICKRV